MLLRVLVSVLCAVVVWAGARRVLDVRTTQGIARGYLIPHPPHYAYLGIPYAAPTRPRFKIPEPLAPWDGIFEATHRVRCPQGGSGDENCLVVNVFTPEVAASLPVLVFVHDGHFQNGWGSHKPPAKLLAQGLVIVTFNYRLGILGFLCLKIPAASGNFGLKDQIAALYWVQRNIARFGGDPSDVTVYGIGSGAVSVQILLLSKLAKGLIHKVILESGSVLSPTSLTYEPSALAFEVAEKLGYKHTGEVENLVKFLSRVPSRQLSNLTENFLPCIESSYHYVHSLLDEDPMETLKKGFQEVPMVIAYTNTDGMSIIKKNVDVLNVVPEHFDTLLPSNLWIVDEQKRMRIAELVKELYFDSLDGNLVQNYSEYFHEVLFEFPIMKFGILCASKSSQPVYILKFMYKSARNNVLKEMNNEKMINYVYGNEFFDEDNLIANRLVTLLCNFIKLGDPTPITTSMIPIIWRSVTEGSAAQIPTIKTALILQLDNSLTMITTHGNQRMTFWDHVYNSFYRNHSMSEEN